MQNTEPIEAYIFPDKPTFEETGNTLNKSIISILLYIATFYFLFGRDLKYTLILVLALFIHESGHFIAMKYYNYKDVKMFFVPLLGAFVSGEKHDISPKQKAIILLAGPVPGIIIGLILYYLGTIQENADMKMAGNIFTFLNMFNLLPFSPLDGGRLMETLFFNKRGLLNSIFTIVSVVALTVIFLYYEEYLPLLIPFFLMMNLVHKNKIKKIHKILDGEQVCFDKSFEELTNKEYWLIRDQVINHIEPFKKLEPKVYKVALNEKKVADGVKSILIHTPKQKFSALSKAFFISVWLLFFIGPVIAVAIIYRLGPEFQRIKMATEFLY